MKPGYTRRWVDDEPVKRRINNDQRRILRAKHYGEPDRPWWTAAKPKKLNAQLECGCALHFRDLPPQPGDLVLCLRHGITTAKGDQ